MFLRCSIWRQAAENVAESLQRGMRVVVQGRLKARSYETREGEKRTVFEIEVEEIGPSLKFATAKVNRVSRSGGQGYSGGGAAPAGGAPSGGQSAPQSGGQQADDPWATPAPAAATPGNDPWGAPGVPADEPPF
jgi:single-strand DNA-binding protein